MKCGHCLTYWKFTFASPAGDSSGHLVRMCKVSEARGSGTLRGTTVLPCSTTYLPVLGKMPKCPKISGIMVLIEQNSPSGRRISLKH